MKPTKYQVDFENGNHEYVTAMNINEARILAQAEQIKKGCSYEVTYITNVENISYIVWRRD